ncbi:MAG: hypothetical protein A2231_05870 [Candidatus Firestonebacteria bacterium RIFOXYA2_FULL_40_8]|nr:MAG: hypothetical protein A2231_05870 [Candidatus Firestonebacteria bacterium RIFOXYA2_FULL_40_8]
MFSKWEARNKPADEKEIQKEIETAEAEFHKEEDKKSFRIIEAVVLGVLLVVIGIFFVVPAFQGPERRAAVNFITALKALELEKLKEITGSKGLENIMRSGVYNAETLEYLAGQIPDEYDISSVVLQNTKLTVTVKGKGKWSGSEGKLTFNKEEGRYKFEEQEWDSMENGMVLLPSYNENSDITQTVKEKAADMLSLQPLPEKYYKTERREIKKLALPFYKKGRILKIIKEFTDSDNGRVVFSGDGKYLLSAGYGDFTVKIWKTADWTLIKEMKTAHRVDSVTAVPDGSAFIMGDAYENITIIPLSPEGTGNAVGLAVERGGVLRVAVSGNSKLLATGSFLKMLTFWSYPEKENILFLNTSLEINDIAFSPAAPYLAAATNKNAFALWELKLGTGGVFPSQRVGPSSSATAIAFSPNGRYVLTGYNDSSIVMTDLMDFKEKHNFFVKDASTMDVAFSADGRVFSTAHANGKIYLWDTKTARKLDTLKGHKGMVNKIAFSPKGKYLVSAGEDKKVIVWSY